MNYLRKAFNLYQLTHRVDASPETSATDIKELDEGSEDVGGSGSKNGTSTRSAATKARTNDMFTTFVMGFDDMGLGFEKVGTLSG